MSQPESDLAANLSATTRQGQPVAGRAGGYPPLQNLAALEIPSETLRSLPADFVKRHRVLPFRLNNGTIHVAAAEPGNQRVIDDIRLLTGLEVEESEVSTTELVEKI